MPHINQYSFIMKLQYLFPNRFKKIGWFILIPFIALGFYWKTYEPEPYFLNVNIPSFLSDNETPFSSSSKGNLLDEIISIFIIVGSFLVAFSKEVKEDEFIAKIRLDSLVWSVYFNYTVLALAIIFIHGWVFLDVMLYNLFTVIFFFIIRFNWMLYKMKQS